MENLRYMLSQYNPKVALLIGHRYLENPGLEIMKNFYEGFMAGRTFHNFAHCFDFSSIVVPQAVATFYPKKLW